MWLEFAESESRFGVRQGKIRTRPVGARILLLRSVYAIDLSE
jgi:hypothetical protein